MARLFLMLVSSSFDTIPFIVRNHMLQTYTISYIFICIYIILFVIITNIQIYNNAALHKAGAYTHLMNNEDREDLKWLHVFK